jgi:hypothetical protein
VRRVLVATLLLCLLALLGAELAARRAWRSCEAASGPSAAHVEQLLLARWWFLAPACSTSAGGTLVCTFRAPLSRWACCSRVERGRTAGQCGSG